MAFDDTTPVWVVDDDRSIRFVLERALKRAGIGVRTFDRAQGVREALKTEVPSVLVSDIRMPGESGTDLLNFVKGEHPEVAVIIMTAYSDLDNAVSAFQGGAFDYLAKPFDLDKTVELIERAKRDAQSRRAVEEKPTRLSSAGSDLIGRAAAMQDVFRAVGRLSHSHVTVLITGESGTGKEVIARSIWAHSQRSKAPYVAINMGAIPRELLESELFGHEKGAFTGATAQRIGRFEQAHGGTIFLDEIGEMPMELQTALLRVLSNGTFYRVGGQRPIEANVRVIAATNRNLEERVKAGLFREDLYHRLNVIRLRLPPLRDRREDIEPLANHFLKIAASELGVEAKVLSPEAIAVLSRDCPFPGNIRQLENLCRWLTVMAPATEIAVKDLPEDAFESLSHEAPETTPSGSWETLLAQVVREELQEKRRHVWSRLSDQFERTLLETALAVHNGARQETAEALGVGRNTVTRKIKDLQIDA